MEELLNSLKIIIQEKNHDAFEELVHNNHPNDLAKAFMELNDQMRQGLYEIADEDDLATILEYLDEADAAKILHEMSYAQGAEVLQEMSTDDAADLLKEIEDDENLGEYLSQMDSDDRASLEKLSSYEEGTAGSIMSVDFIKLESGIDVKEATKILGYEAHDAEVIDSLFVVKDDKLIGVLELQDLIIARTPKKVDDIMSTSFVYAEVDEDVASVADKIKNYDIYALPILDHGMIVGIVTMDDAIDVANQEIVEDLSKLGAVGTDDSNVFKNVLKRIPWLVLLLVISLLISNITSAFEDVIKQITVLWFFNTMILDMAGNSGTQSLAVAVRRIARDGLKKGTFKFILKEFAIVSVCAIILTAISFLLCFSFISLSGFKANVNAIPTSLVIAASLGLAIMVTGLFGSLVPIVMNKIKIDPAVASGPIITTINDIIAMLIYFGLAIAFMPYLVK